MKCTISIIVPVYNVGSYLPHCLQSILDQGLDDYEVLLVNDASHDNSGGICIEWCAAHPQFRLINHATNRGLSEARNSGLDQAGGTFIAFVDSDDFLAPGTLRAVLSQMEEADAAEFPVMRDYLTKRPSLWKPSPTTTDFDQWMTQGGFAHCYAWNKIYRRELWEGIRFPAGRLYEDLLTIPSVLGKARRIKGVTEGVYYYCTRPGSISNSLERGKLREYLLALTSLLQMPLNSHNTALYIAALNAQITYHRHGGSEWLVPHRPIPWKYLWKKQLTPRERLKAWYLKLLYNPLTQIRKA